MPLYYILLNLFLHVLGTSEASVRLLSVLASLGSITLLYILGRSMFSRRAGVYSALMFAVAPFQVAYAQWSRPHTLMLLLALVTTLIAVRLSTGKKDGRLCSVMHHGNYGLLHALSVYLEHSVPNDSRELISIQKSTFFLSLDDNTDARRSGDDSLGSCFFGPTAVEPHAE